MQQSASAVERSAMFDGYNQNMALFEQRIPEEEVTAAREKMAAGASLRSAAAEIPCAPSTLSTRIKKAEQAAGDAHDRARIRDNERHAGRGAAEDPDPRTLAARHGTAPADAGPVETLRGALLATKASGQPDWPTRVSAARALAALRPDEVEAKADQQPAAPAIVVYDLPPGTDPVLHRAPNSTETAVSPAEAPPEQLPTPELHTFYYERPDGENEDIGTWSPARLDQSAHGATLRFHQTGNRETAELWLAELAAGRLPQTSENAP